jgi:hypothetical protein
MLRILYPSTPERFFVSQADIVGRVRGIVLAGLVALAIWAFGVWAIWFAL